MRAAGRDAPAIAGRSVPSIVAGRLWCREHGFLDYGKGNEGRTGLVRPKVFKVSKGEAAFLVDAGTFGNAREIVDAVRRQGRRRLRCRY